MQNKDTINEHLSNSPKSMNIPINFQQDDNIMTSPKDNKLTIPLVKKQTKVKSSNFDTPKLDPI